MTPIVFSVRAQIIAVAMLVMGVAIAAFVLGMHASAVAPERMTPSPAQSQPDGSVIAARQPDASPAKAPHIIPRGAVEERRVSVTVQPRAKQAARPSADPDQAVTPSPVRVDLSLVRMDGGRRVIASSPDGDVVGALDVPIDAAAFPVSRPWAAGLSCEPMRCRQTTGAWIDRDLGKMRVGVELGSRHNGEVVARLRVGVTW